MKRVVMDETLVTAHSELGKVRKKETEKEEVEIKDAKEVKEIKEIREVKVSKDAKEVKENPKPRLFLAFVAEGLKPWEDLMIKFIGNTDWHKQHQAMRSQLASLAVCGIDESGEIRLRYSMCEDEGLQTRYGEQVAAKTRGIILSELGEQIVELRRKYDVMGFADISVSGWVNLFIEEISFGWKRSPPPVKTTLPIYLYESFLFAITFGRGYEAPPIDKKAGIAGAEKLARYLHEVRSSSKKLKVLGEGMAVEKEWPCVPARVP